MFVFKIKPAEKRLCLKVHNQNVIGDFTVDRKIIALANKIISWSCSNFMSGIHIAKLFQSQVPGCFHEAISSYDPNFHQNIDDSIGTVILSTEIFLNNTDEVVRKSILLILK